MDKAALGAMLLVVIFSSVDGLAQSPDNGATLYREHGCAVCHGKSGLVPERSTYPVLAGQSKDYLVNQIMDIRDGVRENGQSRLMRPMVAQLTREQIEAIAIYLSAQPRCAQ